jgi:hypothetical protein
MLRRFCPTCYRGFRVEVERVPADSPRIDEEQRKSSSLPLLDLESEGPRCKPRCRLICLVCANPVAFPSEPDYDEALQAVERYEEELEEARAEVLEGMQGFGRLGEQMLSDIDRRFQRQLRRLGMAWHPRWRKLVHSRCVKKAKCDCVLSVKASVCPTHKRSVLPPTRRPPAIMPPKKDEEERPARPPPVQATTRGVTIIKATWLKPPTSAASCVLAAPTSLPAHAPRPVPASKPKPKPCKPNLRLQQAAAKCTRLDGWTGQAKPTLAHADLQAFDERRHHELFDPFQHGYFSKNGVDMYRFPHGPAVQVFSAVNTLTKDGRLIPG